MDKKKFTLTTLNIIIGIGVTTMVLLPLMLILPGIPQIWYRIDASAVSKEVENIVADLGTDAEEIANSQNNNEDFQIANRPELDSSLPRENRVLINSIDVNGRIFEGGDAEATLAKGIWRTFDFGTPDSNFPVILASHRYGNPNWSTDFRDKELFYNLDKVKVDDKIEIIWEQRKYRYEIYKVEVATQISRTDFDLLVYTCNYWNSPLRIFAYAKRI